jgi:MFS transporter, PAT family, beta-lactamase induction signal transducer AmpG
MSVDLLEEHELGRANALMWASKMLGIALGAAGLGSVVGRAGLPLALVCQLSLLLVITLLPLLVRERVGERLMPFTAGEPMGPALEVHTAAGLFRQLRGAFSLPAVRWVAALALSIKVASGAVSAVAPVMLTQRLGWTAEAYAQAIGGPVLVASVLGALLAGKLIGRLGAQRTVTLSLSASAVAAAAIGVGEASWGSSTFVVGLIATAQFFEAAAMVGLLSLAVRVSLSSVAGTQFALLMALGNVSLALGSWLAGPLSSALTEPQVWLAIGGTPLVGAWLATRIRVERARVVTA